MVSQTAGVIALIKQLEEGKLKLKLEYEKGIRALDQVIKTLCEVKLDPLNFVHAAKKTRKPGRPKTGEINVRSIVKKAKGKNGRGRPAGSKSGTKVNLTQMLYDTVISKNQFVHSREIVESVVKKFPHEDRIDFGKKISVLLASLKKQGRLITFKDGGYRKNIYWGAPIWLSKEGRISRGKGFKKSI